MDSLVRVGTRLMVTTVLGIALLVSPGCKAKSADSTIPQGHTTPVAESDWRNRLSLPASRIARNWVLADNTMLVELEYNSEGYGDTPQVYSYEIYDPKTNQSTPVVTARYRGMVRKIDDRSVEFVCDDHLGLQYLRVYDIGTRTIDVRFPAYPATEPRQFGLSNIGMKLVSVSADAAGVQLVLGDYPAQVPWMKVSGQDRTVVVELPGLAAVESVIGPVTGTSTTPLVEAVAVESGVSGHDGETLPGSTIRITTSASNLAGLSYSMTGSHAHGADQFTIRLNDGTKPIDLGYVLSPPEGWTDWRQNVAVRRYEIDQIAETRDGILVLGSKTARFYEICDPRSGLERIIVGEGDWPSPCSITDREVVFLCHGGGGGPIMSFPYFEVYDVATRSLTTRDIWLSLTNPSEMGGSSWTFGSCAADPDGVLIDFKPSKMMAGGDGPPTIRTWADEATHTFCAEFPDAMTEGMAFGPIDLTAAPFVESAMLVSGVRGEDGASAPGITLQLTLDPVSWAKLTYHIDSVRGTQVAWGDPVPAVRLTFSDEHLPTTGIDVLPR